MPTASLESISSHGIYEVCVYEQIPLQDHPDQFVLSSDVWQLGVPYPPTTVKNPRRQGFKYWLSQRLGDKMNKIWTNGVRLNKPIFGNFEGGEITIYIEEFYPREDMWRGEEKGYLIRPENLGETERWIARCRKNDPDVDLLGSDFDLLGSGVDSTDTDDWDWD